MGFTGFFEAKIYDSIFSRKPVSLVDFLGGFDSWHITKDSFMGEQTVRFEIRNETTLASGTRYPITRGGIPISMEEYIRDPGRYNVHGINHGYTFLMDRKYSLNYILSKKPSYLRNSHVKTGLGGGTITQIFIWEEKFHPCYKQNSLDFGLPIYLLPSL